jgi:hypothetical protein
MSQFHHSTASHLANVVAPRSPFFEGKFGRLFPELAPWRPPGVAEAELDRHLLRFVNRNMLEQPAPRGGRRPNPRQLADRRDVNRLERKFGSRTPAGYTYFGQFVDHDITFDPASSLARQNDPNMLKNFRTPRLDLDNVYGQGPNDQPYMYDQRPRREGEFLVGSIRRSPLPDLPRNSQGRALIGDMRNDENSIVCQLQLAFLLAHNTLVGRAREAGRAQPFEDAQRVLRWLYQWIVWHDFVGRMTEPRVFDQGLQKSAGGARVRGFAHVYDWRNQPFMPVEFSVAAYRFGHSMVRNAYQTNINNGGLGAGLGTFVPIFDNSRRRVRNPRDLRGFRRMTADRVVQWDWFLPMNTSVAPDFPQRARKVDTKLANALSFLHEGAVGDPLNILAFRNLKRGITFDLPAGTAVARHLGETPIDLDDGEPDSLWYYILKEAETRRGRGAGQRLGPVGSTIVCATFEGLLAGDPNSWFNVDPTWTPNSEPLLRTRSDRQDDDEWRLASIIRLSGLPVSAGDF